MLKLKFKQFPVLSTPRLLLREHDVMDVPALFKLRTNEAVMQYIDRERPQSEKEIQTFINLFNDAFLCGQNCAWVIALQDNPEQMIGSIGYWKTDLANHRAEIGYMLHPNYWRKGIISEALKATLNFGFDVINFHTVQANINPKNNASRQLLLKNGFTQEAYFKQDYLFNGVFLDTEIYGKINPNH